MNKALNFTAFGLLISALIVAFPLQALELQSQREAVTTIELYTSEGCSSCPRADAWLSSLSKDSAIFSRVIPLAFHVDYGNQLGWRDRFSEAAFSSRQRALSRANIVSQVYTPGFVVNNREWRAWFNRGHLVTADQLPNSNSEVGVLAVRWPEYTKPLSLSFAPIKEDASSFQLHVAIIGMGLETQVRRGENRGRLLKHDFVVLSHAEYPFGVASHGRHLTKNLAAPDIPDEGQKRSVLVVWVSEGDSPAIVQAVAGYL